MEVRSPTLLGLLFLLFLAGWPGCSRARPLTTEAYVWQQVRTPAVDDAVRRAGPELDGFYLQAANVVFALEGPKVRRFDMAWRAASETGKRVGIVLRIPSATGGLGSVPEHARVIGDLIGELQREAGRAGVQLDEVQIDYDCPESKLEGYGGFLRELKAKGVGGDLIFTALPSWLRRKEFRRLAGAADGYVLQVHVLEPPGKGETEAVVCDVRKARAALAEAERIGKMFRVALPTYRSVMVMDREEKPMNVISEGDPPPLPDGGRLVPGAANARELAGLVAELKAHPPRGLVGIVWYRLPVETDRMNWPWLTFLAVAEGRRSEARLEVTLAEQAEGYVKVEIRNAGELPEPWPEAVRVRWKAGQFAGADGLNGYGMDVGAEERSCVFRLVKRPLFDLAAGRSVTVGWVRVEGVKELEISP